MHILLKDLKKQGFDIEEFYCEDLTNPKAEEINRNFNMLSPKLITDTDFGIFMFTISFNR